MEFLFLAYFCIWLSLVGSECNFPPNKMRKNRRTSTILEFESRVVCSPTTKYRSYDGSCNNENSLGMANTPFRRLIAAVYADASGTMREDLPNARTLSTDLGGCIEPPSSAKYTKTLANWAAIVTTDIISTQTGNASTNCCVDFMDSTKTAICKPIDVGPDSFYGQYNFTCLPFRRSHSTFVYGNREQLNMATSFLDAGVIYGPSEERACKLRTGTDGLIRAGGEFEQNQNPIPWEFLPSESPMSGSDFAPITPGLLSFHNIMRNLHNLCAKALTVPAGTNDETIFQETKRIISALMQKITYEDLLPILLGESLIPNGPTKYNMTTDPTLPNSLGIALRFGHSLLTGEVVGQSFTSDVVPLYLKPQTIQEKEKYASQILAKQTSSGASAYDCYFDDSVRNRLLAPAELNYEAGLDLPTINIQRSRDHGIPSYKAWREHFGLDPITTFADLTGIIQDKYIEIFEKHYTSVDDMELFPAGLAEVVSSSTALLGPTFKLIIKEAFKGIMEGDKFFYKTKNQNPYPFKTDQIKSIEQTSLAIILCKLTQMEEIQPNVFITAGYNNENHITSCLALLAANPKNIFNTISGDIWELT